VRNEPTARVLGEHPQVYALEWESRFLVDPGGFEDLARTLTVAYTPYHADDALGRLAWLLNVRLTGHSYEAFRGWGLAEELGIERYRAAVGRLWQQLAWYEFDEAVPPLGYRSGLTSAGENFALLVTITLRFLLMAADAPASVPDL
jgi:omega-hydroxy-beta-dihydromenaquinone-9 sulfotransferase